MDRENDSEMMSRAPTLEDLLKICEALNQSSVKYVVLGGMALMEHGLMRGTMDIDLLVDSSESNIDAAREALSCLQDKAALDVRPSDVREYGVVRIQDEITVDLMGAACGIDYVEAEKQIEWRTIQGVRIPFASLELLWATKQTCREKDALDRIFLKHALEQKNRSK